MLRSEPTRGLARWGGWVILTWAVVISLLYCQMILRSRPGIAEAARKLVASILVSMN